MRHGVWWPDRHARLAQRGNATFNAKRVHAGKVINGKIGLLSQPFLHDTAPSIEALLRKLNQFSTLGAEERCYKYLKLWLLQRSRQPDGSPSNSH